MFRCTTRIFAIMSVTTLLLACGGREKDPGADVAGYSGGCNFDLLRICLANNGGDVPCQKHRGQNNCSAADVQRVKGGGSAADSVVQSAPTQSSGYRWPTDSRAVTSYFGPRASPCAGCSSYHQGIDIGIATGTSLYASNNGNASGSSSGCGGNSLSISGAGVTTRYLHLSSFVAAGKYVTKGQVVARSGNTGSCTTGPHLHFEFHVGGTPVNPLSYLR